VPRLIYCTYKLGADGFIKKVRGTLYMYTGGGSLSRLLQRVCSMNRSYLPVCTVASLSSRWELRVTGKYGEPSLNRIKPRPIIDRACMSGIFNTASRRTQHTISGWFTPPLIVKVQSKPAHRKNE